MTCPLSLPQEYGRCHWCRKALKGRQKRWCSRACSKDAVANHRWTQAKAAAKAPVTYYLCARALLVTFAEGFRPRVQGPPGCEGFTRHPEVNHKDPILGKHGSWGCHHHQDGLEVLCRPCHLEVTARQREEGKFK